MARIRAQSTANAYDEQLYGLIRLAMRYQDEHDMRLTPKVRPTDVNPWREVVGNLYRARPYVRDQMHPEDRNETEG